MTNPWEAGDETGERSKHQIVPYQASDLMGDYSFLPRTNPGKWIEAQELLCPRARELRCPYINPNSHWLGAIEVQGQLGGTSSCQQQSFPQFQSKEAIQAGNQELFPCPSCSPCPFSPCAFNFINVCNAPQNPYVET